MDLKIKSSISSNVAEVSSGNTLNVNTPMVLDESGFVIGVAVPDSGLVTGSPLLRPFDSSQDYRLRVGVDNILWQDNFCYPVLNNNKYLITQSGQTVSIQSSGLTLNSGGNQNISTSCNFQTFKPFSIRTTYPLYFDLIASFSDTLQSNSVTEFGFGFAVSSGATTDGIYFSTSGSSIMGVVNFSGQSKVVTNLYTPVANEFTHYLIVAGDEDAAFWADDILLGRILTKQVFSGSSNSSNSLPLLLRNYNLGAVSNPISFNISSVGISQADTKLNKKWNSNMATNGQSSISRIGDQVAYASGTTSANLVNSTAPSFFIPNVDFSNAISAYSTLGGDFSFSGVAQSEVDYVLFSYLNPSGSSADSAKTLVITDVNIISYLSGATIGTTDTNLQWSIGVGATSSDLTTQDSVTLGTRAARRLPLGNMAFPVGTVSGGMADRNIFTELRSPLMVEAGTYCQIIVKIPVATNTAGQVFKGNVMIGGYFE